MVKKRVKKKPKKFSKKTERKIGVIAKNLILFVILFVFSFILYNVSDQEMYVNLFFLLSVVFGFVVISFLIVYLIFFFVRIMRK